MPVPSLRRLHRAYLHHLFKSKEILGAMLLTWHNLHYYQSLMRDMRAAIRDGLLGDFRKAFEAEQAAGDIDPL